MALSSSASASPAPSDATSSSAATANTAIGAAAPSSFDRNHLEVAHTQAEVSMPSPGRVNRIRQNWAVHEDGALAQRLQEMEIETHLGGNRRRNHQIREDFPKAYDEQSKERGEAERVLEERRREQRMLEERDAELARRMEEQEREHRKYEAVRDEIFARKLQNLEKQRSSSTGMQQQQQHLSQQHHHRHHPGGARERVPRRPEPQSTPPLPVMSNGDVPDPDQSSSSEVAAHHSRETSFHDLNGGIRYNDEQYLVKTATPALITPEPLYANNKPEHYAVANAFPTDEEEQGAVGGAVSRKEGEELLGAAGLSQKDLAVAKRVEAQLEQERRDRQLARQLQDQLSYAEETQCDALKAMEARDLEIAKKIHEKEKAKLRRAKERAKLKKLEKQRLQEEAAAAAGVDPAQVERSLSPQRADSRSSGGANGNHHHNRQHSGSRSGSRLSKHSTNQIEESPPGNNSVKHSDVPHYSVGANGDSPTYALPARRPYVNPSAIDQHLRRAEGAAAAPVEEPTYENLRRVSPPDFQHSHIQKKSDNLPVPPYMPMQQSKKSSSMEKRLNKKKEKEGCKQQ